MTRRVEDFGKFMREHVNLNPSRYERLKRSDKASLRTPEPESSRI